MLTVGMRTVLNSNFVMMRNVSIDDDFNEDASQLSKFILSFDTRESRQDWVLDVMDKPVFQTGLDIE